MQFYTLTREQEELLDRVKKLSQKVILPLRQECDENEGVPLSLIETIANERLFGIHIPIKYSGIEMGVFTLSLVMEEISKVCGGIALIIGSTVLGSKCIVDYGTDEQKNKYLPLIATGKMMAAFALTEANAGSDPFGIETHAKEEEDYFIINGCKQWVTNGDIADLLIVVAKTGTGKGPLDFTAFIVEKNTEGLSIINKNDKMGIRASTTCHVIFENVKVKKDNIIRRIGYGMAVASSTLSYSRLGVGAQAIGIAAGALDEAMQFSCTRKQNGEPIYSLQCIQHMIADMATKIEMARSFLYQLANAVDSGMKKYNKYSAMVKMYCSDIAMAVTTDALQILGGYGYMKDFNMEKRMRDAKITQIYEGTNQILKNEISRGLLADLKSTIDKKLKIDKVVK